MVSIDPDRKSVVTDQGVHDGDVLVVALGADLDIDATPGLREGGREFYSTEGASQLTGTLAELDGGDIVIAVLGAVLQMPSGTLRDGLHAP